MSDGPDNTHAAFEFLRSAVGLNPSGVQIGEATDPDSGQPQVVLWFRLSAGDADVDRVAFRLTPDRADAVAEQLTLWAARTRLRSAP